MLHNEYENLLFMRFGGLLQCDFDKSVYNEEFDYNREKIKQDMRNECTHTSSDAYAIPDKPRKTTTEMCDEVLLYMPKLIISQGYAV